MKLTERFFTFTYSILYTYDTFSKNLLTFRSLAQTLDGAVMVLAAEFSPCGNHVSYKIKNEIVYVLLYIYFVHLLRIKYNNFGKKKLFFHTFSKMGGQSIGCIHPASHAAHVDNPHRIGYRLSLPHEALNRPPVSETSSFWSWIGC